MTRHGLVACGKNGNGRMVGLNGLEGHFQPCDSIYDSKAAPGGRVPTLEEWRAQGQLPDTHSWQEFLRSGFQGVFSTNSRARASRNAAEVSQLSCAAGEEGVDIKGIWQKTILS